MDYFDKGKENFSQGRYSQALEYLMAAMEEDKLNAEICYWCAMAYKHLNSDFNYRKNIFKALSINPDYAEALTENRLFIGDSKVALEAPKLVPQHIGNKEDAPKKNLPVGFSVSPTRRVLFAPGNVVYEAKNEKWKFAEKQYSIIGTGAVDMGRAYMAPSYYKEIRFFDLFQWGISDNLCRTKYKGVNYFAEWGDHFPDKWRTLSWKEWKYLFCERANAEKLCGYSKVCGRDGVVVFPDNWSGGEVEASYDDAYSWEEVESSGAVFLPATSYESGKKTQFQGWAYQTSSHEHYYCHFDYETKQLSDTDQISRNTQLPVRLVKDVVDE